MLIPIGFLVGFFSGRLNMSVGEFSIYFGGMLAMILLRDYIMRKEVKGEKEW
jgi:hypothetical protein